MRKAGLIFIVLALAMVGCVYEAPLAPDQNIKIDGSVLGLWQQAVDEGKPSADAGELLVLEYTETEYLVCYKTDKDDIYFRGYPIKVEGMNCVQMQLIGVSKGSAGKKDRKYQVVSYTVSGDTLEFSILNDKVIDAGLKTTEQLKEAFAKNKDKANLFQQSLKFTRMKPTDSSAK